MTLDLSNEDLRFVREQLAQRARNVEAELVRTDKHELQHALANDLERLQRITGELDRLLPS